jgi:hypothetical protein
MLSHIVSPSNKMVEKVRGNPSICMSLVVAGSMVVNWQA